MPGEWLWKDGSLTIKAVELCRMAGLDLAALKKAAIGKDFKPVTLAGATATFKIENTLRKIDSQ